MDTTTDPGNITHAQSIDHLLQLLRQQIERVCNATMRTPKDFDQLGESIFEQTHEMVNASTLKRLYGYVGEVRCPRESTLDILCRYVGYTSWQAFVARQEGNTTAESSPILSNYLYSDEMYIGERLRILWQPDRELTVEYNGYEHFTVIEATNSKLQAGNTFRCPLFIQQEPLYLTEVTGLTGSPVSYVCGSTNGIVYSIL